ncbi:SGNH/GDSL hydrolase family protein [Salinimicrobium soli]|uniref:SGNH/GDSL hydrolase family protein n=1 Tax=Salinimicrobium soli TaxID=1254399 RepID=UPI003AAB2760
MRKFTCLAVLILSLISCNNSSEKEVPDPVVYEEPMTYLALGDSYTIGESVAEEERWPMQLVDSLQKKGVRIRDPKIIAKTGWTTADLLAGMDEQLENGVRYDLVSILIGVNNQYQGRSIEEYEQELRVIFDRALALSFPGKAGVFAVSIPDYGATPFGASKSEEIAKEIEEFNAVFQKVALEYGVDFYNITPISKRAKDEPSLVANDGLHPSGEMYSLWVEEFLDEILAKVSSEI